MAKIRNDEDMEPDQIRQDLNQLKVQMNEVLTLLGGSASYEFKGMRADVRELKIDMGTIKLELAKMKQEAIEKERDSNFLRIRLKTIPQKLAAILAFGLMLLTIFKTIQDIFTK